MGYALAPIEEALRGDRDAGEVSPGPVTETPGQGALNAVYDTTTIFPGQEQNLEFIAKRLLRGKALMRTGPDNAATEKSVLLGTPIYVALMD